VLYSRSLGRGGDWSTALIYGANKHTDGGDWENSVTAETNLDLDSRNAVFGRLEYVRKSAEDLAVQGSLVSEEFDIGSIVLGYVRELATIGGATIGAGVRGALNFVPADLEPVYGTRSPTGLTLYVRIRPKVMRMGAGMQKMDHQMMPHDSMPDMQMPMEPNPSIRGQGRAAGDRHELVAHAAGTRLWSIFRW